MKKSKSKFAGILRDRKDEETPNTPPPPVKGKRTNPDYAQVTAYIPKKLHEETKIRLIRLGNREFSDLVFELLLDWNMKQGQ